MLVIKVVIIILIFEVVLSVRGIYCVFVLFRKLFNLGWL